MDLTERTVKKNTVYRGKIISLRVDDALLPDGNPCRRELVEHPGGASVLYVEEGKVLLVKQYRYAYGKVLREIPQGGNQFLVRANLGRVEPYLKERTFRLERLQFGREYPVGELWRVEVKHNLVGQYGAVQQGAYRLYGVGNRCRKGGQRDDNLLFVMHLPAPLCV